MNVERTLLWSLTALIFQSLSPLPPPLLPACLQRLSCSAPVPPPPPPLGLQMRGGPISLAEFMQDALTRWGLGGGWEVVGRSLGGGCLGRIHARRADHLGGGDGRG